MDANKIEVKMTLAELRTYEDAKREVELKLVALERQLAEASLGADPDGTLHRLVEGIHAARKLVGFAVANCPPETTKGWPTEELRTFARTVLAMPDCSVPDQEQAQDWIIFSREADAVETFRHNRTLPRPPSSLDIDEKKQSSVEE